MAYNNTNSDEISINANESSVGNSVVTFSYNNYGNKQGDSFSVDKNTGKVTLGDKGINSFVDLNLALHANGKDYQLYYNPLSKSPEIYACLNAGTDDVEAYCIFTNENFANGFQSLQNGSEYTIQIEGTQIAIRGNDCNWLSNSDVISNTFDGLNNVTISSGNGVEIAEQNEVTTTEENTEETTETESNEDIEMVVDTLPPAEETSAVEATETEVEMTTTVVETVPVPIRDDSSLSMLSIVLIVVAVVGIAACALSAFLFIKLNKEKEKNNNQQEMIARGNQEREFEKQELVRNTETKFTNKMKELEAQKNSLAKKLDEKNSLYAMQSEKLKKVESDLASANANVSQKENSEAQIQKQLEEKEQRIQQLETQLQNAQKQVLDYEKTVSDMKNQIQNGQTGSNTNAQNNSPAKLNGYDFVKMVALSTSYADKFSDAKFLNISSNLVGEVQLSESASYRTAPLILIKDALMLNPYYYRDLSDCKERYDNFVRIQGAFKIVGLVGDTATYGLDFIAPAQVKFSNGAYHVERLGQIRVKAN
ncbi:hypothetical protein [Ruminococcus sp.]|uniref:hypothetical protein n=1 Tax=Ruminococcus sp. TaxID=41978 RepID=UPI0025F14C62|nr:hypothetical protein [Ruminococcus sp.]